MNAHDLLAIQRQLRCMADDLTIGCNDHANHGPQGRSEPDEARRFQLSDYLPEHVVDWVLGVDVVIAPQPVPAAQVLPVQAVVTQAPAWLVVADGRTIATFSDADDAHAYRRWLNRSTTGVEVES